MENHRLEEGRRKLNMETRGKQLHGVAGAARKCLEDEGLPERLKDRGRGGGPQRETPN